MTHWISVSEEWNATARWSMATLTTVVSRIDMTAPSITTPATIRVSRSSPSGCPAVAEVSAMPLSYRTDESGYQERGGDELGEHADHDRRFDRGGWRGAAAG